MAKGIDEFDPNGGFTVLFDPSAPFVEAKTTGGDVAKSLGAGIAEGIGMVAQGGGNLLAQGINRGAEAITGRNPMLRAVDPLEPVSRRLRESRTEGGKLAQELSTPTGSIDDLSSLSFGDAPTAGGYLQNLANVVGQFAVPAGVGAISKAAKLGAAAQYGIGAGTGALQAGGAASSEEGERVRGMDFDALAQASSGFRDYIATGMNPAEARERTALDAELGAGTIGAIPAAAEGAILQGLFRGKLKMPALGDSRAAQIGTAAIGGGIGEAGQEVTEGVAQRLGANIAAGLDTPLLEDSFANAVLGFGGGAVAGAGFKALETSAPSIDQLPPAQPPAPPAGPLTRAVGALPAPTIIPDSDPAAELERQRKVMQAEEDAARLYAERDAEEQRRELAMASQGLDIGTLPEITLRDGRELPKAPEQPAPSTRGIEVDEIQTREPEDVTLSQDDPSTDGIDVGEFRGALPAPDGERPGAPVVTGPDGAQRRQTYAESADADARRADAEAASGRATGFPATEREIRNPKTGEPWNNYMAASAALKKRKDAAEWEIKNLGGRQFVLARKEAADGEVRTPKVAAASDGRRGADAPGGAQAVRADEGRAAGQDGGDAAGAVGRSGTPAPVGVTQPEPAPALTTAAQEATPDVEPETTQATAEPPVAQGQGAQAATNTVEAQAVPEEGAATTPGTQAGTTTAADAAPTSATVTGATAATTEAQTPAPREAAAEAFKREYQKRHGDPREVENVADKMVDRLMSAIEAKAADTLIDYNLGDAKANPASRAAFEAATGVKLPKGRKATHDAIDAWAGVTPEERARREQAKADRRAADSADREAKADEDRASRFRLRHDGKEKTGKQFVDEIIAAGFDRVEMRKKGVANITHLVNDAGDGYKMLPDFAKYARRAAEAARERRIEADAAEDANQPNVASDEDLAHLFGKKSTDQPATTTADDGAATPQTTNADSAATPEGIWQHERLPAATAAVTKIKKGYRAEFAPDDVQEFRGPTAEAKLRAAMRKEGFLPPHGAAPTRGDQASAAPEASPTPIEDGETIVRESSVAPEINGKAVEAAHIEDGKTAPASPAEVEKAAKLSPLDAEAARADLLEKVREATASAPSWADALDARDLYENPKTNTLTPKGKQQKLVGEAYQEFREKTLEDIGYASFHVPGDGTFKVLKTKEALERFAKNVEKSRGFSGKKMPKTGVATPAANRGLPIVRPATVEQAQRSYGSKTDDELRALEQYQKDELTKVLMRAVNLPLGSGENAIGQAGAFGHAIEGIQREMVRRGLRKQTDLDAVGAVEEETIPEGAIEPAGEQGRLIALSAAQETNDRDTFTLERVGDDGKMETATFRRGETVKIAGTYPMKAGTITGISQANQQFRVDDSTSWHDFGFAYPQSYDEFAGPRAEIDASLAELSKRLDEGNSIGWQPTIDAARDKAGRFNMADYTERLDTLTARAQKVEADSTAAFKQQDEARRKAELERMEQERAERPNPEPVKMTMDEWKKLHRDTKGIIDGQRMVLTPKGMAKVEIIKAENEAGRVLETIDAAFESLTEGTSSVEQYREAFKLATERADEVKAALSAKTKDELLTGFNSLGYGRYKNEKKAAIVDALYDAMVRRFALGKSYGPQGFMMGQHQQYEQAKAKALRELVEGQTAETLAEFAAEMKAAREEAAGRRAERLEAVKNPKTIDDFRAFIDAQMRDGKSLREARMELTTDQRAEFDRLLAEQSRAGRKQVQDDRREIRVAGQKVDAEIIATKHTKKGHDLFVVRLAERVPREDYDTLNTAAKRMGGYYSSFRGAGAVPGFQFTGRATAEAFVKLANGDASAAQEAASARRDSFEDDRSQTAVERLTEMADRLEERADESLAVERKANTDRRARMAASAEASANADKALAKTMRNIATAISDGRAKFLDRVRQKVQVEMMEGAIRRAKDDELRARYPNSYGEQEKRRGEPATSDTVEFADFPTFTMFRSDLATLGRQLSDIDGLKQTGAQLMRVADDVTAEYTKFAKDNFHKVAPFAFKDGSHAVFANREAAERAIKRSNLRGKAIVLAIKRGQNAIVMSPSEAQARGIWKGDGDKRITLKADIASEIVEKLKGRRDVQAPWQFVTANDRRKALARMGIETPAEYRSALREFISLREQAQEADRIKELERSMVGRANDGLDFFPTPASVADAMIEAAEVTPGMAVLEPSAGMGHIADRIRAAGAEPDVIEASGRRRELLEAKGYHHLESTNFLNLKPREFYTYGDVFEAPDGKRGILRGLGGLGSQRVRLDDDSGNTLGYYDRADLKGVAHRGTQSGYDRIIMNPPFSDGRDMKHVRHAYDLLKPGGRVVAIMGEGAFFRDNKEAREFREWLESVDGTSEKLAEGTFQDPTLPVTTGVNARMVVIDKAKDLDLSATDINEFRRQREEKQKLGEFANNMRERVAQRVEQMVAEAEAGGHKYSAGDEVIMNSGQRVRLLGKSMLEDTREPLPPHTQYKARREAIKARPKVPGYWAEAVGDPEAEGWFRGRIAEWGIRESYRGLRPVRSTANDDMRAGRAFQSETLTPEDIKSILEERFGKRGIERLIAEGILQIRSMAEMPTELQDRAVNRNLRVTGAYSYSQDAVTIIADGGITAAEIVPTLIHELGEHFGLQPFLGKDGYAKLLDYVRNEGLQTSPGLAEAWASVASRSAYSDLEPGSDRFVREVIASFAEKADAKALSEPWFKRVLAAIRRFFWKYGLTSKLSDDDIRRMVIASARQAMRSGVRKPGQKPLSSRAPDGFDAATSDGGADVTDFRADDFSTGRLNTELRQRVGDLFETKRTFNWWHKSVGTQYHKATIDKDYRRVFERGQAYISDLTRLAMTAADQAQDILPRLERLSDIAKSGASPREMKPVAEAMFAGTLVDERVYADAELRERFGMNPRQIRLYRQSRAAIDRSLEDMATSEMIRLVRNDVGAAVAERAAAAGSMRGAYDVLSTALADRPDLVTQIEERVEKVARLKREGYAPLMRFGRYSVTVSNADGSTEYFGLFEDEAEARKMEREMREQYPKQTVTRGVMSQEGFRMFSGLSPDTLELFAEAAGIPQSEAMQQFLKLAVNSRSALKRLIQRKGIAGYNPDLKRVLAQFITSNARAASGNLHYGEMMRAVEAIPREKGDVRDEAIRLMGFLQNPQEEAQALRSFLFFNFLGGSVAAAAVNMTQPVMMSFPYLARWGATRAAKELLGAGGNLSRKWITDPALRAAMDRAANEGLVEPHQIYELQGAAMHSERDLGPADPLRSAWRKGLFIWGRLFAMAESFNRRLTFAAAFRIGRELSTAELAAAGVSDPYAFAAKAVVETQGIYNRGNRPDWARGAVGATVFTFKQYSISYMEFLKRLPPRERALALGVLILAAGVNGLPGADDLDDVIDTIAENLGYNLNSKARREEFVAAAISPVFGAAGVDFVNNGASAGLPLDFQARLGLQNLIPGTGVGLKSRRNKSGEVIEAIGPFGGLVENVGAGLSAGFAVAAGGDPAGAVVAAAKQAAPIAVQNALRAAEMMQFGFYRDTAGRRVVDTDAGDAFVKAIGFNPSAVAASSRVRRTLERERALVQTIESEIADLWAQGVFEKSAEKTDRARQRLREWNQRNPETPIRIAPAQIKRRVVEMGLTADQRYLKRTPKELRARFAQELGV